MHAWIACIAETQSKLAAGDAKIAEVLDLIAWQTPLAWSAESACQEDVWPPALQTQVCATASCLLPAKGETLLQRLLLTIISAFDWCRPPQMSSQAQAAAGCVSAAGGSRVGFCSCAQRPCSSSCCYSAAGITVQATDFAVSIPFPSCSSTRLCAGAAGEGGALYLGLVPAAIRTALLP